MFLQYSVCLCCSLIVRPSMQKYTLSYMYLFKYKRFWVIKKEEWKDSCICIPSPYSLRMTCHTCSKVLLFVIASIYSRRSLSLSLSLSLSISVSFFFIIFFSSFLLFFLIYDRNVHQLIDQRNGLIHLSLQNVDADFRMMSVVQQLIVN